MAETSETWKGALNRGPERRLEADSPGYGVYTWGKAKYAYYNSKEGHHAMHLAEGGH